MNPANVKCEMRFITMHDFARKTNIIFWKPKSSAVFLIVQFNSCVECKLWFEIRQTRHRLMVNVLISILNILQRSLVLQQQCIVSTLKFMVLWPLCYQNKIWFYIYISFFSLLLLHITITVCKLSCFFFCSEIVYLLEFSTL